MDIGADSGKVVKLVALQIQCLSLGINVCEHQVKVFKKIQGEAAHTCRCTNEFV